MKTQEITKEQILEMANKITDDCAERLVAGISHKNVKRHLAGMGFSESVISILMEKAQIKANDQSHYKIGKYSKEYKYSA